MENHVRHVGLKIETSLKPAHCLSAEQLSPQRPATAMEISA